MGDEVFQTKKNEPTHISLHCLEQAVCCIMYCNSGPNFSHSPADVTSDDAECASSTAWIQEEARWTQTSVCSMDSVVSQNDITNKAGPAPEYISDTR